MEAQAHEDRRRETEAAHPIVDEDMQEGLVALSEDDEAWQDAAQAADEARES